MLFKKNKHLGRKEKFTMPEDHILEQLNKIKISKDLETNLDLLRQILGNNSPDVVIRKIKLGEKRVKAAVIHIDGLVSKSLMGKSVLEPLLSDKIGRIKVKPGIEGLKQASSIIESTELKYKHTIEEAIDSLFNGSALFFLDGSNTVLAINIRELKTRNIDEPPSEPVVRGPREGFTEHIRTNTSLIRRRLKTPRLRVEGFTVGALTKTSVEIMYIKGVANEKVVEEVRRRLKRIKTDSILESGYIEEFIEDDPLSPFNTTMRTERPDKVAAQLLEGCVAIITDNTPFVLTLPADFNSFLQASEDYYGRYYLASFLRILRLLALLASFLLPSLWVAITSFHPEALPTALLLTVAAAREGIPFPSVVEAFLLEFVFEVLREAGLRLPRQIGSAISIIGGVVLGDAAVRAGLISTPMLVIVAFTGIASFAVPDFTAANTFRLLRFPLLILAGTLGIYGLMLGVIIILIHMTGLRSFGVPYMGTSAPLIISNLKDSIVRAPWWAMDKRPRLTGMKEPKRQEEGIMPRPPSEKDKK